MKITNDTQSRRSRLLNLWTERHDRHRSAYRIATTREERKSLRSPYTIKYNPTFLKESFAWLPFKEGHTWVWLEDCMDTYQLLYGNGKVFWELTHRNQLK